MPTLLLLLSVGNVGAAEPIKAQLFGEADSALQAAQAAQADLYSPKNYERAMKHYSNAQARFERGRNLDSIRAELARASEYLKKATETSRLARAELAALIKTRDDAQKVNSARYASDLWARGEESFSKAVLELEHGAPDGAKERAREADRFYRDAELVSIKATYLSETRLLIARAEKEKIYKHAPKTLEKAKTLLRQADKALNDNRYDTDLPRSVAQQANYEARHAIYLAQAIERARASKQSMEDVILDWEAPIREIAAAADMKAEFDSGYRQTTEQIVTYIDSAQTRAQRLDQDVKQLQAEVTQLQQMVGGVSAQRLALSQRLQEQAQIRRQFDQVEQMFTAHEARVLRESNDIIIRLVGLSFDVGEATIAAKNYQLLTKVQNVMRAFPDSKLVIEGHTDSHGSDTANYVLSQRRAESVKQYLLANMRIDSSKVDAVGYGENKPIANNETSEGRAKNRRIDLVIRPKLGTQN